MPAPLPSLPVPAAHPTTDEARALVPPLRAEMDVLTPSREAMLHALDARSGARRVLPRTLFGGLRLHHERDQ